MNITRYGHACMLVEEGDARLLIDPGTMSEVPAGTKVDAIFITHNHSDHLDPALIKKVLADNPDAAVITVAEAAKDLDEAGIQNAIIEEGGTLDVNGVTIQSFGTKHAYIYGEIPQCQNTGFLIAGRLYYPGDSFYVPGVPVEVLALPTAGPWMKTAECIDFAKAVHPKVAFPIHDGFIKAGALPMTRTFPRTFLEPEGIELRDLDDGETLTI